MKVLITKTIILSLLLSLPLLSFGDSKDSAEIKSIIDKGYQLYEQEMYSEALECYTRGMEQAKASGDYKNSIICIGNIANIFGIFKDYERSIYYNRMGCEIAREHKDYDMLARLTCTLIEIYCYNDDIGNAEKDYSRLKDIPGSLSVGNRYHTIICQALIAKTKGHTSEAIYFYERALQYAADHDMHKKYIILTHHELGKLYMANGQSDDAFKEFETALDIAREIGSMEMTASTFRLYAEAYKKQGDTLQADKYRAKAVELSDSIFNGKRFNAAKNKLFEYEQRENRQEISVLTRRISHQMVVIGLISVIALMLVIFSIIIVIKNRNLHEAQQMLIKRANDIEKSNDSSRKILKEYIGAVDKIGKTKDCDGDKTERRNDVGMSEEQKNRLLNDIISVLEDVEVISSPDFNLNTLVSMVDSNTSYVSWCINDAFGKNFKTLLNEYRIREASRRLSDSKNYGNMTIQAIYENLGYKSASNFIKAFKNVMGMTPSMYMKIKSEENEE